MSHSVDGHCIHGKVMCDGISTPYIAILLIYVLSDSQTKCVSQWKPTTICNQQQQQHEH